MARRRFRVKGDQVYRVTKTSSGCPLAKPCAAPAHLWWCHLCKLRRIALLASFSIFSNFFRFPFLIGRNLKARSVGLGYILCANKQLSFTPGRFRNRGSTERREGGGGARPPASGRRHRVCPIGRKSDAAALRAQKSVCPSGRPLCVWEAANGKRSIVFDRKVDGRRKGRGEG